MGRLIRFASLFLGAFSFRRAFSSQSPTVPSIEWVKGITFGNSEAQPHGGVQTSDGGFLMVGDGVDYSNTTVVKRHILVARTDSKGDVLWQTTLGFRGYNYGKFGIELPGGDILVAGATTESNGLLTRSMLRLAGMDGSLLSSTTIENADTLTHRRDGFMCVAMGENDKTIIATGFVGGENSTSPGYPDEPMFLINGGSPFITKFELSSDAQAPLQVVYDNVLDDSTLPFSAYQGMRLFYDPAQLAYVVSTTTSIDSGSNFQFGLASLSPKDGSLQWIQAFPAQHSSFSGHASHPYALALGKDGSYAVGGLAVIYDSQKIEQCQGRLVAVDAASGGLLWDQRFTSPHKDYNIECYGLQGTLDGGYILACGTGVEPELHPHDSPKDKTWMALVHRTYSNGSVAWQAELTRSQQSKLQNNAGEYIVSTRSGDFALYLDSQSWGSTSTGGNFGLMLLSEEAEMTVGVSMDATAAATASRLAGAAVRPPKTNFSTIGALPTVQLFPGVANVPSQMMFQWPPPPPYNHTVKELGHFASEAQCQQACIEFVNTQVSPLSGWTRCQSFSWSRPSLRCIGVLDASEWKPVANVNSTAGRLQWPLAACRDDGDCSYNGVCGPQSQLCHCQPAWTGDRCQSLALQAASKSHSGLRARDQGSNTSTWGGSILLDQETGIFHMWSSEITQHCGIDSWTTNSQVVHATSPSASGPFVRQEVVWPVFSHEPNVVRAPGGEWVMFFTGMVPGSSPPVQCGECSQGNTPSDTKCPTNPAGTGPTFMTYSKSPAGPWATPKALFERQADETNMDTNLAVVIKSDGTVMGIARTGGGTQGIIAHLVTASDWKNASSYQGRFKEPLFPNTRLVPNAGLEDPFVYLDRQGVYHAVFHSQIEQDDERLCGGHAFSLDGYAWNFTGTAWSNRVDYTDASWYLFSRRERPHLVFADAGDPFKPTHLSTGVQYGPHSPISVAGEDACFTLVQPIAT